MFRKRFGAGMDRMPDFAFKMMSLMFKFRDRFFPQDRVLDEFGIQDGQVVVDYGCGPGSYIGRASKLVGAKGKVFAVDIHELAIDAINKKIAKENLNNVSGVVAKNGKCPLDNDTANLVFALDMFHMVSDSTLFLKGLNRIIKPDGVLFIDNGHQPRKQAKTKILASVAWDIVEENDRYMKCKPTK
ncbi:MAG: class I SAM-dependent methyltransferase [Desulfobacteraceae bacterium]|nr:class I SAM-dependent methyltransferase [Desulfobacteraceae bacterium]MBC2755390.1 class I SAM-dependent methyltransferase [Desulfobacteraceae bacterium]